jgi:hypothetical protein
MRVEVKPELLQWARERAGVDNASLARRFPKLADSRWTPLGVAEQETAMET